MANVVYFLSSDEAGFINGENITIDGGYGNVSVLLQKEMESSRVYGSYEDLIKRYNKMKKGEKIFSVDVADSGYAWIDTPNERAYLNSIVEATQRGVETVRFIVLPKEDIKKFKEGKLFKEYVKYMKESDKCFIVSKEELFEKLNGVYQVIGKGCDVSINKKGEKQSFIDFYSDDNSVGVLTDSEIITENLYENITVLHDAIKSKTIKTY